MKREEMETEENQDEDVVRLSALSKHLYVRKEELSVIANHNLVPIWWTIPVDRDSWVLHGHTHVRGTMTDRPFNLFSRCKLPS